MALFRTIKRAFGFADSEMEEEELEGIDARVTPLRERLVGGDLTVSNDDNGTSVDVQSGVCAGATTDTDSTAAPMAEVDGMAPVSAIFESVVKIFNEALPSFLKSSVDEKAQCDYLYQSLASSVKQYIDNLEIDAQRRCNIKWENERKSMQMQMQAMRLKAQKDEEECSGSKKLQLSAERQKRALAERVHDLEKQLASVEAENEQYVLENKSLINKIRLNSVLASDGAEVTDEALMAKNSELVSELDTKKAEYQALCEEKTGLDAKVKDLTEDNARLHNEIKCLNDALEQSRVKDDVGDAMLSDLNEKAALAEEKLNGKEQELQKLSEQFEAETKRYAEMAGRLADLENLNITLSTNLQEAQASIEKLTSENASLQGECNEVRIERDANAEKLHEALENLGVVEEMHMQLTALEEARLANDAFVRKQKDDLMQKDEYIKHLEHEKADYADALLKKDETISTLEELADSLRKTIENNLYEHAQAQSALRSEIDRLKMLSSMVAESAENYAPLEHSIKQEGLDLEIEPADRPQRKKNSTKKSRLKISAIDETIEDTDWLIATPPAKKKDATDSAVEEFGYKEPVRKTTPDNPAQMSLW